MDTPKTSPHLEDHYKVVGVVPGIVQTKNKAIVDLRTISLAKAHELHAEGFPFLKSINNNEEKKAATETDPLLEKEVTEVADEDVAPIPNVVAQNRNRNRPHANK